MLDVFGCEGPVAGEHFDQRAWLERIDYSGSLAPTLETLNGLIFAHAHAISYETLDIMLGRPPGSMSAPSKPR